MFKETLSQQCSALPLIIREDRASEFNHQAINLRLGLGDEGAFSGDPQGIICSLRPAAETHCRAQTTETHSPVATWGSGCGHWCGEKLNWCNTQLLRFKPPVCVIVGYYHTHTHTRHMKLTLIRNKSHGNMFHWNKKGFGTKTNNDSWCHSNKWNELLKLFVELCFNCIF